MNHAIHWMRQGLYSCHDCSFIGTLYSGLGHVARHQWVLERKGTA